MAGRSGNNRFAYVRTVHRGEWRIGVGAGVRGARRKLTARLQRVHFHRECAMHAVQVSQDEVHAAHMARRGLELRRLRGSLPFRLRPVTLIVSALTRGTRQPRLRKTVDARACVPAITLDR